MRVLDLFSGIGGFSLGLERAGMRTVAFCEIDPAAQAVLAARWPGIKIYNDVRELSAQHLTADGIGVDVIAGGFPCQDISSAGKGAGINGERSGLWKDFARLIGEIRPRYAIVENVAALLGRGLGDVLGDLAALRYDAEWHCIPASAVGAPHRRDRIWIVANPSGRRCARSGEWKNQLAGRAKTICTSEDVADATEFRQHGLGGRNNGNSKEQIGADGLSRQSGRSCLSGEPSIPYPAHYAAIREGVGRGDTAGQWWIEPHVGRVAHGVPDRTHRLRLLGNAVVPQIPEIIGRAILAAEQTR